MPNRRSTANIFHIFLDLNLFKIALLCSPLFLIFFSGISFAESIDFELKICSGKPGGTYIKAAYWLSNNFNSSFSKVKIIDSSGSLESHLKLAAGECDIALAQGDALPYFKHQAKDLATHFFQNTGESLSVEDLEAHKPVSLTNELLRSDRGLYLESVHFMCNRELGKDFSYKSGLLSGTRKGINSIEDFLAYLRDIQKKGEGSKTPRPLVYLGPSGGGSHATFFALKSLYQELAEVNSQAIDESNGLDNGVSAGLLEVFNKPTACFLYVSKSPHKIITLLNNMGGPLGPPAAFNQRMPTLSMNGGEIFRYYFEAVKIISSATENLLKLKDFNGVKLFSEQKIKDEYNSLRMTDEHLDFSSTNYYSTNPEQTVLLATPTQIYASDRFYNSVVSQNDQLRAKFTEVIQEAQQRRGNFPEE